MVVTLASIVRSVSDVNAAPGTSILNAPLLTVPVYSTSFTVKVTVSPSATSPPTVPVIAIFVLSSAALMMSSDVISASSVIVAVGGEIVESAKTFISTVAGAELSSPSDA